MHPPYEDLIIRTVQIYVRAAGGARGAVEKTAKSRVFVPGKRHVTQPAQFADIRIQEKVPPGPIQHSVLSLSTCPLTFST